jgi:predicted choloylglycine hydrolase
MVQLILVLVKWRNAKKAVREAEGLSRQEMTYGQYLQRKNLLASIEEELEKILDKEME